MYSPTPTFSSPTPGISVSPSCITPTQHSCLLPCYFPLPSIKSRSSWPKVLCTVHLRLWRPFSPISKGTMRLRVFEIQLPYIKSLFYVISLFSLHYGARYPFVELIFLDLRWIDLNVVTSSFATLCQFTSGWDSW